MMNYFGVFPPWDMRNRSTRTRSPLVGEPFMLIVYVPEIAGDNPMREELGDGS